MSTSSPRSASSVVLTVLAVAGCVALALLVLGYIGLLLLFANMGPIG